MYLDELYQRLMEEARLRVRSGVVSERALARQCGISQPHMHNVLKNIRALSPDAASRLMQALDLNVAELLWRSSDAVAAEVRAVPLMRNYLGPGSTTSFTLFNGFVPFASTLLTALVNPVAARLGPDLVMPKAVCSNDLALLDQNVSVRASPDPEGCWVVNENGNLRVRYVRVGGTRVYLVNEATLQNRTRWDPIPLDNKNILDVIKAKIVWVGRDMRSAG